MKKKINFYFILITTLATIVSSALIMFFTYTLFEKQIFNDLKDETVLLKESGVFNNIDDFSLTLDDNQLNNIRITWIDIDGNVLFDNGASSEILNNHLDRPEIKQAITNGYGQIKRYSQTTNMNNYYYALLLNNNTILRLSTQVNTIYSMVWQILPLIIIVLLIIIIICVMVSHLISNQLIKPINDMVDNLDQYYVSNSYDELIPIEEKLREQHEKILSDAKMRQDFSASVSHELKTPLTAISGYAQLLQQDNIDSDKQIHMASQIEHNANRLLTLINDIIKLSQLDNDNVNFQFTKINLYTLVQEVCEQLYNMAASHNIALYYAGDDAYINGDEELIKEVIENLVSNAIVYNKDKGYVKVSVINDNNKVRLKVSDNGIGIAAEHLDHVFERFYRVDKSRSKQKGGTGLGLAIVKHIVILHNGTIDIESQLDKGTTITITF